MEKKGRLCNGCTILAIALCLTGCVGNRGHTLAQGNRMAQAADRLGLALQDAADGLRKELYCRNAIGEALESWTGTYSYYQYYPPNINISVKMNVYSCGGGYFAYLQADGFQTLERLTARIEGDREQIDVCVYDIDPALNSYFQEGSLLFSLKKSSGELLTRWEDMWFFERTGQWEKQFEFPGELLPAECAAVPEEEKARYLQEHGFEVDEPNFRYYDESGNLQLVFYYDEELSRGAGFRSGFSDNGFSFEGYTLGSWQEPELLALYADGEDGAGSVENYREVFDYNDSGQLTHYRSEGDITWLKDHPGRYTVVEVNFKYREDGSLCMKEMRRNPNIFGSTGQWTRSWYDEAQRLVYQEFYITHGSYESYYFYEGDSWTPSCSLQLDSAGWTPCLVKYGRWNTSSFTLPVQGAKIKQELCPECYYTSNRGKSQWIQRES